VRTLTEPQIQEAITYNQARHGDANEIGTLRDILGLSRIPEVIDRDFVLALVEYQAQYGLPQDGKLGRKTAERLAREIVAEAGYLGPGNEGSLAGEFQLKTDIDALITANNRTYADYKRTIQAGTMIQGQVALQDRAFLRRLQGQLSWDNFAKCIELLGRTAPSGADMIADSQVRAALIVAWNASSPAVTIWPTHDPAHPGHACNPPPGPPPPAPAAHEEGGFIYLDLITGDLATRAVAPGGQAVLPLNNPPLVANSIVVGGYHTHPNVGACWGAPFFSGPDQNWVAANGVPLLMRGAFPGVANTSDHAHGSSRRHLAGNRGLPGPTGGIAPQSSLDGKTDDL
jgi:hypothetical protein